MFEAWLNASKLDMKKVPYRNAVEAARDLAENRVQLYESAVAIAQPQIEAGKIKLLAVLNSVRTPAYPNIPTVAEAGHPALTIDGLVGLFGPPTMPMAVRERIAADVKEVMESDPIIKDRLTRTGQAFNPGGPAEFGASIETQRATGAAAATAIGLQVKQWVFRVGRDEGRRPLVAQAAVGDRAVMLPAAMRALHADRKFRHALEIFRDKLDPRRNRLVGIGAAEHQLRHELFRTGLKPSTPAGVWSSQSLFRQAGHCCRNALAECLGAERAAEIGRSRLGPGDGLVERALD